MSPVANRSAGLMGLGIFALLVAPAWAQEAKPPATQPAAPTTTQPAAKAPAKQWPFNLATSSTLTGDWGGVRTKLKDVGFTFSPVLYSGYMQNYRGGVETRHGHDLPGYVQYNAEFDFNKLKLIPGGSFFIRGLQSWNDNIKGYVGSLSAPAYTWGNGGDHEILVDKWWWRQRFLDDRIELRLGKIVNVVDLFDTNAYAGSQFSQFNNSFLTTDPTMPSTKGLGAFIKAWPTDWLYVQAAAIDPEQVLTKTGFDTAFHGEDHFRAFWEFGFTPKWDTKRGKLPGNYRFGWWYDPQRKLMYVRKHFTGEPAEYETGDMGLNLSFDQMVWKEKIDAKDKQGLGLFARYGWAGGDRNKLEHFWSCGAQYEGLLPGRDHDVLGFGVAQGILSEQYHEHVKPTSDRETVYEMYYLVEITPWLCITPDIQFITNPGGDRFARDSIVGGVRVKIAF